MREITIEECRRESAALALTNELHARHRAQFAPGQPYNPNNPEDKRIYIDAVFIPDGCIMPKKLQSWYGKGGGMSSPGEPGSWMFNVGYPKETAAHNALPLFASPEVTDESEGAA